MNRDERLSNLMIQKLLNVAADSLVNYQQAVEPATEISALRKMDRALSIAFYFARPNSPEEAEVQQALEDAEAGWREFTSFFCDDSEDFEDMEEVEIVGLR